MKASLETSALFLSTTLELKNFVSPDLKFHCFLLPNFRSKKFFEEFFWSWNHWPIPINVHLSLKSRLLWISLWFHMLLEHWSHTFYNCFLWSFAKVSMQVQGIACYPETFQAIRKFSGSSGKYPAYPETFQALRKLSRLSRNYTETFQAIRKISGQSGKYPDYLEIFQRVRKLPSAILRVTRKNFPDAQKLSGWQCHPATQVFGPLVVA